jgi:hypothetical protein
VLPQGCEIGQQAFCLMSPTLRLFEMGDSSKSGNLLTMFLTGPLMAFCLTSGNTDPSTQQLVDLQVRGLSSTAGQPPSSCPPVDCAEDPAHATCHSTQLTPSSCARLPARHLC